MHKSNLKREFFGVEFHVKNVEKLLIDYINEFLRGMNVIHGWRKHSFWNALLILFHVNYFKRCHFVEFLDLKDSSFW